jgi:5-methylcytosine-specific restriction endonuclease McrA
VTEATQVDHIVPLGRPYYGLDVPKNRQSICDDCHRIKTEREFAIKRSPVDASGEPTDPNHPWNRAGGVGQKPLSPLPETAREAFFSSELQKRGP